jgi:hypothetical protein
MDPGHLSQSKFDFFQNWFEVPIGILVRKPTDDASGINDFILLLDKAKVTEPVRVMLGYLVIPYWLAPCLTSFFVLISLIKSDAVSVADCVNFNPAHLTALGTPLDHAVCAQTNLAVEKLIYVYFCGHKGLHHKAGLGRGFSFGLLGL